MVVAGGGWRWLVLWNGKIWFISGFHCADIAYSKEIDVPFQTFVLFTCQISRNFQHFAPDFCGAADVILGPQMNPGGLFIWREFRWRNSSGERPSLRWMEESFTGGVPSSELSSDEKSSWPFIDGGHCTRHRELGCVVRQWWWVVGGSLTLHGLSYYLTSTTDRGVANNLNRVGRVGNIVFVIFVIFEQIWVAEGRTNARHKDHKGGWELKWTINRSM